MGSKMIVPDNVAFGYWLSGLTDGEGCFSLEFNNQKRGSYPVAAFSINLRDDDIEILCQIQRFLGCGDIRRLTNTSSRNSNPTACFRVRNIRHLVSKIIPQFNVFPLRAKKKRDFDIWRIGVALKWEKFQDGPARARWRQNDRLEYARLVELLKSIREYKPKEQP